MKSTSALIKCISLFGISLAVTIAPSSWSQGTAFTYQGQLIDGGRPANGYYDLQFSVWNAASGPSQVGVTVSVSSQAVSNGLFTVLLDFDPTGGPGVFNGSPRWLDIAVRTNGASAYTNLVPRQQLTAAPYAQYAAASTTANSVAVGSVTSSGLAAGAVGSAAIADNSITASDLSSALSASTFWRLAGNTSITPGVNFMGTTAGETDPVEFRVNNTHALRMIPAGTATPNVVGGYSGNTVSNGVMGAHIGGGGKAGLANAIGSDCGFIGGGLSNSIQDLSTNCVIAGGSRNLIEFGSTCTSIGGGAGNRAKTSEYTTIGGGSSNTVFMESFLATIGGGGGNTLEYSEYGTIGGGKLNTIDNSDEATIAGGANNTIGGESSRSCIGGGGQNQIAPTTVSATIGGGIGNIMGPLGNGSVIGGGYSNRVEYSSYVTIGGGYRNTAGDANYATIPGGYSNRVAAYYAFAAGRQAKANHQGAFVWADSTAADFASTANNQFLVRAAGGVGLGTASPNAVLDVFGTRNIAAASDGIVNIGNSDAYHVTLDSNEIHARNGTDVSALYLNDFGGNVHAGRQLYVVYDSGVGIGTAALAGYKFYVNGTAYSTGGWSGSDARWKKNVQPVTGALKKVNALQGVTYEWRRDEFPDREFDGALQLGFIAQDVERVVPEAVRTGADGYKAIAYEKLTAVLTEGVKEQQQQIEDLKARNAQLEQAVAELKALVEGLARK